MIEELAQSALGSVCYPILVGAERDGARHRGAARIAALVRDQPQRRWTADRERKKPGRDLGYSRYDKVAEPLGCYAEYVEEPEGIVGFVNVKTDWRARASTACLSCRET